MAFNLAGTGTGALGGAGTGFMIGGPWGAAAGAVAGGVLGSGLLGGSGGGPGRGSYPGSPPQAQLLDLNAIFAAANANAAQQSVAQFSQQQDNYLPIQNLQLGTIGALAANLNNSYTELANGAVNSAIKQAGNLSNLGNVAQTAGVGMLSQSGPNALESGLYNQAGNDLALGSSLSAEDQRAATQQANASWASRGLGTGSSAGAAEILGRYQLGQQRLQQRQGAAIAADNVYTQNPLARYGAGMSGIGMAGNLFSNAGNLYNQSANTAVAIDPYQRAMGIGASLAGQNLGNSAGILGQTYAGANQQAGNVASFNANMLDSRYNAWQNNQAALQGAQIGANGQLLGAGIGALGSIGGAYLQSQGSGAYGTTGYGLLGTLKNNWTNAGHADGTT